MRAISVAALMVFIVQKGIFSAYSIGTIIKAIESLADYRDEYIKTLQGPRNFKNASDPFVGAELDDEIVYNSTQDSN
tara:strand:- start:173 stop:403 length:231 start_codon:yes stop_codon:yes gene_type:complete